jgi:CHAD domain-containing protein
MPYRLKINEPVEKGFRRNAREQLDVALAELASSEIHQSSVHECRKALKRMRALVRLASGAIGRRKARRRAKALSEIARLLADRRDQAVMLQTISNLATEGNVDVAPVLAPLRRYLVGRIGEEAKPLDADSASQARLLLLQEAKKFSRTRFDKRGFAALRGGLEQSYRKARKATKEAYSEPSDESFHTLRKAVQWHWRQMSLLAHAWPDEFAVRVSAARELSQMLGDDHDLSMLISAAAKALDMSNEEKEGVVALCLRQQQELRNAAEFRARRLFAEAPKEFVKRMAAYWRCSRILDPRAEAPAAGTSELQGLRPDTHVQDDVQFQEDGHLRAEDHPARQDAKPASSKPRLSIKAAAPAPSQRRA